MIIINLLKFVEATSLAQSFLRFLPAYFIETPPTLKIMMKLPLVREMKGLKTFFGQKTDSEIAASSDNQASLELPAESSSNSLTFSPGDFLSSIIHELKTPLNAIVGFTDVLKTEMSDLRKLISDAQRIEECNDYLSEIERAASDMNELIHDLLDVGSVASGNFSVDMSRKIDISDVIKRSVRMNYDYAIARRIRIKVEISDKVRPINLDAKRMKQILTNLISNSIKYSPEGSEVKIICTKIDQKSNSDVEGQLEISVIDRGFGMTKEQLATAFSKYQTIANENSYKVDSFGLGLPITKQLVELQKGIIEVKSEVKKGTEMKVIFKY